MKEQRLETDHGKRVGQADRLLRNLRQAHRGNWAVHSPDRLLTHAKYTMRCMQPRDHNKHNPHNLASILVPSP